jgi:hypothetical protein
MRLVPDGPDRSPWIVCLVMMPMVLVLLIISDVFKARRYRKSPWERPLTILSTVAEWKRMKIAEKELARQRVRSALKTSCASSQH